MTEGTNVPPVKRAGTAREVELNDCAFGTIGEKTQLLCGGPEDRDDRNIRRDSQMHGPRIVRHKKGTAGDEGGQRVQVRFSAQVYRLLHHMALHFFHSFTILWASEKNFSISYRTFCTR